MYVLIISPDPRWTSLAAEAWPDCPKPDCMQTASNLADLRRLLTNCGWESDATVAALLDASSVEPLDALRVLDGVCHRMRVPIVALVDSTVTDELTVEALLSAGIHEVVPQDGLTAEALRTTVQRARARLRASLGSSLTVGPEAAEVVGDVDDHRFRLIVENARDVAVFSVDTNARITSWNLGAERLLGFAEHEILGRPFATIFTPEDQARDVPDHEMQLAKEQGNASDFRWHVRRDGSRFWADGQLMRMEQNGRLLGFLKVLQDRTELRRTFSELSEARDRHQLALRAADLGTWDFNQQTNRATIGERAQGMFGLAATGPVPLDTLLQRVVSSDRERFRHLLQAWCAEGDDTVRAMDVRVRVNGDGGRGGGNDADKRERWLSVRAICHRSTPDAPPRLLGTTLDITETRRIAQVLEELTQSLQRDVKDHAAWAEELQEFAQRLTSATEAMRMQAARTLHEHIQQILVAAQFTSSAFRDRVDGVLKEQIDRVQEMLREAVSVSRDLATELYPPVLYEHGLGAALEWLVQEFQHVHGLRLSAAIAALPPRPLDEVHAFAYRLVHVLLLNLATQHLAEPVMLSVAERDGGLRIVVETHDRVFDTESLLALPVAPAAAFKLADLVRHANVLGGTLRVEPLAEGGGRIEVRLPLTPLPSPARR